MTKTVLGFEFSADTCIQCHACETACKTWRGLEPGISWRRVIGRFMGQYPKTRLISVSVSCLHCSEPPCAEVCPVNAIEKRGEDGAVLVDAALCVGCRLCKSACPVGAPQFGSDGRMQKCDMCVACAEPSETLPACVLVCPTGALSRREMPVEEKRELDSRLTALLYG